MHPAHKVGLYYGCPGQGLAFWEAFNPCQRGNIPLWVLHALSLCQLLFPLELQSPARLLCGLISCAWRKCHQNVFRVCPCAVIAFSEIQFLSRVWVQAHAEVEPWFAGELWSVLVAIGELAGGWEGAGEKGKDLGAELRRWDAVYVESWGLNGSMWWGRNCSGFSHDFWIQIADHCPHVACLTLMVVPLQILESTTSLKVVRKVHEALRHIMAGLIFNSDMDAASLLLLSHGLISENLPLLTEKSKWVPGC